MTTLILATRNRHKTREFAALLGDGFNLRDLSAFPQIPPIAETGASFTENAAIKAATVSRLFPDELIIGDDSGLEVETLSGAPGIFSARYAGATASDCANVKKLLHEMRKSCNRSARFICAIVLVKNGEVVANFDGETEGAIAEAPRGAGGFGYDPVFVLAGFEKTFAELPAKRKNEISHRARAAAKLVEYFNSACRQG